ncbi:MAG TPA: hypothetical protein VIJ14_04515 [Rhabdochlamydiaceae bacterium]
MNSRSHVLFSALHLFLVLLILGLGGCFLALPFAPHVRNLILQFFMENSSPFATVGYALLLLGAILFMGFYALNRGQYYQVNMRAEVHQSLIRDYARSYWKELFPQELVQPNVVIYPNQRIELITALPELAFEEQEAILQRIEKEFGAILAKNLGYGKDFLLTVVLK